MATVTAGISGRPARTDLLSGTPRAHALDRWIFVFMAAWFIAIVLVGFIPDSIMKVGLVRAGARAPFPLVLHFHAILMGSFLLVLLAQTVLMATGRRAYHMQLGVVGMALAAALFIVGLILAPTMYHQVWGGAHFGPPAVREALAPVVPLLENILILQVSAGLLFALFIVIGLRARDRDEGLHKRMMILAVAAPLGAAISRMHFLPSTMPASPLSINLFVALTIVPMLVWDVARNRRVHEAYWIWFPVFVSVATIENLVWDKPWWHATARQIMGV
ncbi:hypothetical protein [Sphingomonas hankyongi]|uniref:DUF2306 domain-containing protein n=1 Tax=Sphingomonas hankyongi TaxID=2908209 RepID=A0ABT0RYH9_9SPHN|nr:hypothetical protein [Sphingomonas hankyongi]MCL6728670.1 hypothetical protein [Sphingomonas hankyongi]